MTRGRPILVTGAHRSGTTWVGKMLALAPGVGYIHEPFSPATAPGISSAPFEHYFAVVTAENEERYLPHVERTLAFRYDVRAQLAATRSPRDAARALRDAAGFARSRVARARPLVKDPIALLSAEWLADRFGMDVVVTIRHPAAFAASVLRLGWDHDFATFRGDERLAPFAGEIASPPAAPLERAALLWRVLYHVVDGYRQRHPGWSYVRHEDAARAPLATFGELYARLGLELTPDARRRIAEYAAPENPARGDPHDIRLASVETAAAWRSQLDAGDIARLREATGDVWPRFYSDADW